jgi:hypothetical protein
MVFDPEVEAVGFSKMLVHFNQTTRFYMCVFMLRITDVMMH